MKNLVGAVALAGGLLLIPAMTDQANAGHGGGFGGGHMGGHIGGGNFGGHMGGHVGGGNFGRGGGAPAIWGMPVTLVGSGQAT